MTLYNALVHYDEEQLTEYLFTEHYPDHDSHIVDWRIYKWHHQEQQNISSLTDIHYDEEQLEHYLFRSDINPQQDAHVVTWKVIHNKPITTKIITLTEFTENGRKIARELKRKELEREQQNLSSLADIHCELWSYSQ